MIMALRKCFLMHKNVHFGSGYSDNEKMRHVREEIFV